MKVRIKFSKTGPLKFIGHLDVMRYFQKLFRRSGIPVSYSEGFSPHQILSFSHPLPLGMESLGEYADIELDESIGSEEAITGLRENSVSGIEVLSFKQIPDKCENAMASVRAAGYGIHFESGIPFENPKMIIDDFLGRDEIIVNKKTKKSERLENIRPFIYELRLKEEGNFHLEMLISSGSINNLKPELVLSALATEEKIDLDLETISIVRLDQYTVVDEKFVSLDDIGSKII